MGVAENFKTFCSNLTISNDQRSKISTRYKAITRRLNLDYYNIESETSNSLYVGSYGRKTAINKTSDMDMLFILPNEVYWQYDKYLNNGQSALLQAVKNSILRQYPNTDIKGDGQAIVVNFGDWITFEVVPVFINQSNTFTFPDSNNGGSWKTTNPKPEIDSIETMDTICNYNLKPLCKMMRSWKNKNDVPIKSLLIDTLAHEFLKNWSNKDKSFLYYDFMTRDFLEYLSNQNENKFRYNAVGSNQIIFQFENFVNKAKGGLIIAKEAIQYNNEGKDKLSNVKWRELYGTNFPE